MAKAKTNKIIIWSAVGLGIAGLVGAGIWFFTKEDKKKEAKPKADAPPPRKTAGAVATPVKIPIAVPRPPTAERAL